MNNNQINNEVLNDLIKINNDRIEGYKRAMDELSSEDEDLRTIFAEMMRHSAKYKSQLTQEVQISGDEPATGTTTSGKIYRAWMDVKAMFTGHDRKAILENCEEGEDAAKAAYKTALNTEGLAANIRSMLIEQQAEIIIAHNHIRSLRDAVL